MLSRCNGLAFFSDRHDGDLPIFPVPDHGVGGSDGNWKKIWITLQWASVAAQWFAQWFVISDDDTFWVIENLRSLLSNCPALVAAHASSTPLYLGRVMWEPHYQVAFTQGSGSVINLAALRELMRCPASVVDEVTTFGDVQVARCLQAQGVPPFNTAMCPGVGRSELFHPVSPGSALSRHDWDATFAGRFTRAAGPPLISRASVTFHHIRSEARFAAVEARLYNKRKNWSNSRPTP